MAFFLKLPGQRALAWLGPLLAAAALVYLAVGLKRAYTQPQVYRGKVLGTILGVLALLVCGLTVFGFFQARALPDSAGAPQVGQKAPEFTLADTRGNMVSLAQLLSTSLPETEHGVASSANAGPKTAAGAAPAPKAVLLVFYRGYW
jgi:hypothetical protein